MNKNKYIILVTGASGFVGKELIKKLLAEGHKIIGLVRKNINIFNSKSYENLLVNDISQGVSISHIQKIDIVIHLAAKTHSQNNNYKDYYKTNVLGTENIINLAVKKNVKFILMLSSIKVNGEGFSNNKIEYTEKSETLPKDAYGISKLESENILIKDSIKNNISYVVLRPPLIYGKGAKGNLLKLIKYIEKGLPLPFISGENKRSLLSLNNLIDAIIRILYTTNSHNNVYLISDDIPVNPEDLYSVIANKLNKKLVKIKVNKKLLQILLWPIGKSRMVEKISNSLIIDNSKIKKTLGWKPRITLDDDIHNMVKGYKNFNEE